MNESRALVDADTCCGVMVGILKYTPFGTLILKKFSNSVISASNVSLSLLPKYQIGKKTTTSVLKQYFQKMYTVRHLR